MTTFPPILLSTCDQNVHVAAAAVDLLDKYWPEHPQIVAACHEVPVPRPAVQSIFMGPQATTAWTDGIAGMIEQYAYDCLILWLDDYMLDMSPDLELLHAARSVLEMDPNAGRIDVWGPLPQNEFPSQALRPYERDARFVYHPVWGYPINLQVGLWRTESLIRVVRLLPGLDVWRFEVEAGKLQNAGKLDKYQLATTRPAVHYDNFLSRGHVKEDWILPKIRAAGITLRDEDLPPGYPGRYWHNGTYGFHT